MNIEEALYIQNKTSAQETMAAIEANYGPFDQNEIQFYMEALKENGTSIINSFEKRLIFNLFYKYFGDTITIKSINIVDYIKLMLSARKILSAYNMIILPYIISSKVVKIPNKKNINKKELLKITASPLWERIVEKYQNPKIEEEILGQIGVILSGEFKIIDYRDPDIHGKTIDCVSDIVIEEYLMYVLMI